LLNLLLLQLKHPLLNELLNLCNAAAVAAAAAAVALCCS
jgi:hypothetical protein